MALPLKHVLRLAPLWKRAALTRATLTTILASAMLAPSLAQAQNALLAPRPLSEILDDMQGAPYSAIQLLAANQAAGMGPKHRNIPPITPFYLTFEGTFIPAGPNVRLAIFSDDGADVYLDDVKVHSRLNVGQHLPRLSDSLHIIDEELTPGHAYDVRVVYGNNWFYGTTDADGCGLFAYTSDGNEDRPFGEWRASTPIQCGGIRWPFASATIQAGQEGHVSAFLATDFDQRDVMIAGQITTQVLSDPCSYSWSASGGTFKNGQTSGQSVVWLAPTTPGTYTVSLRVDDQNQTNQPTYEGGARNDARRGFDEEPQTFTASVTVLP